MKSYLEQARDLGLNPAGSNKDMALLHPTVYARVMEVIKALDRANIPLVVYEGFRHPARQNWLYAQGRTRSGKIVTYAKGWESFHQYGLAVDMAFQTANGGLTWNEPKKGMWAAYHEIARRHGMMPLKFETPHIQITDWSIGALKQGKYPPTNSRTFIRMINTLKAETKNA
jgi:peptidoglycan L-alanyl-D-glutamate endopeptidase CwlK